MAEKTIIDDESFYIDTTKNTPQARLVDDRRADVTGAYPRNPYSHQSAINKSARGGRKSYVYTGGGDQVIDFVDTIPASRRKDPGKSPNPPRYINARKKYKMEKKKDLSPSCTSG